jgi:hypothetical protein
MAGAIPILPSGVLFILLCGGFVHASEEPSEVPSQPLQKSRGQWAVEGRYFRLSKQESISLYGVRRRRFLNENWFWGEAGAGALTGNHGGYFEGGGTVGYQIPLFSAGIAEAHVFSGAGGGGNVREGDGWLFRPALALGYAAGSRFNTVAEVGYARFINSGIRGWTTGITFSYSFWELQ